jgi:serine/threonine-protein kinase
MATVYLGRLRGPIGFSRTVAIKRLHPRYAKDPDFVAMLVDEARLAGRIRHSNVVATVDVITRGDEIFVVMDYVHGESLSHLLRLSAARGARVPAHIAGSVLAGVLSGLHATRPRTSAASLFASCTATCPLRTSWSEPTAWPASSTSGSPRP